MKRTDPVPRFWAKVEVRGLLECWPWLATVDDRGYGKFREYPDGYPEHAQRVAWRYATGLTIPAGFEVMHTCDNPPCVNPAHLRLGTHADNMADKARKGRSRNGRTGKLVA